MGLLRKRTQFFLITVLFGLLVSACSSEKAYQGSGSSGAVAGVMIDSQNSWRGMIVGGSLGAALVGGVSEISTRAAREAAREGKPVAYQSDDGFQRVEAFPMEKGSRPNCRLVREHIYQEGKLVRDEMREVCQ
jgi:hypothetical protein